MRSSFISLLSLLGSVSSAPTANYTQDGNVLAGLQKRALAALKAAEGNLTSPNGCSLANAAMRKDWYVHHIPANDCIFHIDIVAHNMTEPGLA